jgi:metal-responsive CopG/Arc/MetJ family transcriptional regulator
MKEFEPIKQEKTVISIRLDVETLKKIDALSIKSDISRNEFIIQCIDYALNNLKNSKN